MVLLMVCICTYHIYRVSGMAVWAERLRNRWLEWVSMVDILQDRLYSLKPRTRLCLNVHQNKEMVYRELRPNIVDLGLDLPFHSQTI